MGLFKKVFKPVRKVAKKIIPKEVRPFLPYIAASFGPAGTGTFASGIKAALQRGLIAGATSAATDEEGNPLRTGILAAAPGLVADTAQLGAVNAELAGMGKTADALERTTDFIRANEGLKTIAAQTAVDQAAKFAEIRQDEIDEYNRQLQEQGVMNKVKRRQGIYDIYINAGYEPDYVNSVLDKYGYADGGEVEEEMSEVSLSPGKGKMTEIEKTLYAKEEGGDKSKGIMNARRAKRKKDDDEGDLASGLAAAAQGVERAFGRSFGNMEPVPMLRFAKGGEVEIEETDDLSIMDFMKDQGIPYGEQASYGYNEAMSDTFDMFLDMKKNGLIPPTMEFDEFLREVVPEMGSRRKEGIMQMASGYKTDIEEMYEQYVFEMEEMGLEPMSFAEFLAQARAGMAKGGMMKGPDWFTNRVEQLMYQGLSYEEASEQAYNEGPGGGYKDGGKAQRRKKGEPADEIIETEQEIFIDTMPRPRRREGILEVANGGEVLDPQSLPFPFFMEGGRPSSTKPGLDYYDQDQGSKGMMRKRKKKKREEKADGGIMEKDMRGGGFIPEGSKERADDVPARLSKNEFVMTADAVRAAGGGSVNKGAKRMYDLMYTLEGKI